MFVKQSKELLFDIKSSRATIKKKKKLIFIQKHTNNIKINVTSFFASLLHC